MADSDGSAVIEAQWPGGAAPHGAFGVRVDDAGATSCAFCGGPIAVRGGVAICEDLCGLARRAADGMPGVDLVSVLLRHCREMETPRG